MLGKAKPQMPCKPCRQVVSGVESNQYVRCMVERRRRQAQPPFVYMQHVGVANIAAVAARSHDSTGELLLAAETDVEPVSGHRVHADGSVADECGARRPEFVRPGRDQRIGVALACQGHFSKAPSTPFRQLRQEQIIIEGKQSIGLV